MEFKISNFEINQMISLSTNKDVEQSVIELREEYENVAEKFEQMQESVKNQSEINKKLCDRIFVMHI